MRSRRGYFKGAGAATHRFGPSGNAATRKYKKLIEKLPRNSFGGDSALETADSEPGQLKLPWLPPCPPSTVTTEPLMKLARSEAMNTTTSATSSTLAARLAGRLER